MYYVLTYINSITIKYKSLNTPRQQLPLNNARVTNGIIYIVITFNLELTCLTHLKGYTIIYLFELNDTN